MKKNPLKTGILLTNLGTPERPRFWAVRRYLKEFLSDPDVIDLPRWKWWPILNLIILNIRPFRTALNYRKIWTAEGSPLLLNSQNIQKKLQAEYPDIPVVLGMRYGQPTLQSAYRSLKKQGIDRIIALPLYPQFSHTTTTTTMKVLPADIAFIHDYHDHPLYITALKNSIEKAWQQYGRPEKLLISYHGLPERYIEQGDPYYSQCEQTTRLLREALNVSADFAPMTFQSRVGLEKWLTPYTTKTLQKLAGESGIRNVQVICPGFACDCLETLEEIALQNRHVFMKQGGLQYYYIPALNDSEEAITLFKDLLYN